MLHEIGPVLEPESLRNNPLSAKDKLLLALHWLGNGGQYHGVAQMHGVHKSTVCRTVHCIVDVIIAQLFRRTICWPNNDTSIAQKFYEMGGFPSVCGCIDGILINIDAPSQYEENFVDRHGKHSINVMMVSGPNYEIYSVNANWPGSVHDARVLRNSQLHQNFEDALVKKSDRIR